MKSIVISIIPPTFAVMDANNIPETRGRPSKYNFNIEVGDMIILKTTTSNALRCAKSFTSNRGLDWKFTARMINNRVHLIRTA